MFFLVLFIINSFLVLSKKECKMSSFVVEFNQNKRHPSLDNSFDFFDSISDRSDEYLVVDDYPEFLDLENGDTEENKILSKANLELQTMLKQSRKESKSMTLKANCFVFFYKFLMFGAMVINLINGVIAIINPNLMFVKIGPFLAGFIGGIIAIFNLQKQGTERKKVSVLLKMVI